jgi:hypothetical protein
MGSRRVRVEVPNPSLRASDKICDFAKFAREAKQSRELQKGWIASSQQLLAMTTTRLPSFTLALAFLNSGAYIFARFGGGFGCRFS